jgi:hypothetical protein
MKMGSAIFSFGCKIYVCSGAIKAEQNTSLTRRNAYNWNPKISVNPSSILQARFGEINPDLSSNFRKQQGNLSITQ